MDTKFVYHPIISSHCGDEEEDADFLLDDLPFSRLKEVQTNCTIKEECEMSQACSLSVPVKQAQKSEDVAQLEHSFNIISVWQKLAGYWDVLCHVCRVITDLFSGFYSVILIFLKY